MAPITNPRIIYQSIPDGYPVPGKNTAYKTDQEIDLDAVPLDGGVLVKVLYLSIDPYLRGKMRDPDIPSYTPAFTPGQTISGRAIARVLRSESPKIKEGDHVLGFIPWTAYAVLKDAGLQIVTNNDGLPWSYQLGITGATAMTAFYSLREYANWKAGETIFVSTAAGAVGSVVVQLAKSAGLKIIASTGDDAKVKYVKEVLGADVAFNYKTADVRQVLKEHGPIDIYYDNVGGPQLDAALEFTNNFGRIIQCGYASEYNVGSKDHYLIKNMANILWKSLSVNGFIMSNLLNKRGIEPFKAEYLPLVISGKIKSQETLTKGLENVEAGFVEMLQGKNHGKAIGVVAEE